MPSTGCAGRRPLHSPPAAASQAVRHCKVEGLPGFRGVMENVTAYIYVVAEDWTTKQPTLYRARIVKETPKQIRTERTGAAFLCKAQFDPAEVKRTPREAWEAYLAAREQAVA